MLYQLFTPSFKAIPGASDFHRPPPSTFKFTGIFGSGWRFEAAEPPIENQHSQASLCNLCLWLVSRGFPTFVARDRWWYEQVAKVLPTSRAAEDSLFSLYRSGSTGKPKVVVHTTGRYPLRRSPIKYDFDVHPGERFACMAVAYWITGHGRRYTPVDPSPARYWEALTKHNIT
ncbi:hypothetical protein R3P38DRAFT_3211035 [Favolaschia claudopus]|uniref:acetate--CoA ligase n=1 Tax=Favolaschia claudopus TaxID=2862362 RepID=A0AAW0AFU0_9AGAR